MFSIEDIISFIKKSFAPKKIGASSKSSYQGIISMVKEFLEVNYGTYIEKSKLARILQVMGWRRTKLVQLEPIKTDNLFGGIPNEVDWLSFPKLDRKLVELGYTPEGTEEDMRKDGYCL